MNREIFRLLGACATADRVMPPTQLYNEGWMLRLALDWFNKTKSVGHPLSLSSGARWYCEALLRSQFFATRQRDPLAEGWTHADAIIGNFTIRAGEAILDPDAQEVKVTEAKLFSPLSGKTNHAPSFDQAARNVACIAEMLHQAKRKPDQMTNLGFYLLAPDSQIRAGVFGNLVTHQSIRAKVCDRVARYQDRNDYQAKQV